MLKDFFESPEIAAIFATKDTDKESVHTNEGSRLRVSKHTRRRDQNTKRAVRSRSRGHQQSGSEMFSTRRAKASNEERTVALHGENDYYDYDDETGTIVKKKHSVFSGYNVIVGNKHGCKEDDKPKMDVDTRGTSCVKQVVRSISHGGEGYCPSDSAYDTNHDDFTDSLERLIINDDVVAGEELSFDGSKHAAAKSASHRESPYRRCRSSAICGRNCEICRGRNNNVPQGKQRQMKKGTKEVIRTAKVKEKSFADSKFVTNYGMFSSKNRRESTDLQQANGQDSYTESRDMRNAKSVHHDQSLQGQPMRLTNVNGSPLLEHIDVGWESISSSPTSAASMENFDVNAENDGYFGIESPPVLEDREISSIMHLDYAHDFETTVDYVDEYPFPNMGHAEQMYGYDAFSRGPHLLMLYDFKAEHGDDISVPKGNVVLLLDNRDRDWVWVMTSTGDEGYVPRSLTTPYNDCEECRQEEIRQRTLNERRDANSSASTPRTTRTNSRSSSGSLPSNHMHSANNAIYNRSGETHEANVSSEDYTSKITHKDGIVYDQASLEFGNTMPEFHETSVESDHYSGMSDNGNSISQRENLTRQRTSPRVDETAKKLEATKKKTLLKNNRISLNNQTSSPRGDKRTFEVEYLIKTNPRIARAHSRSSSVSSDISRERLKQSDRTVQDQQVSPNDSLEDAVRQKSLRLVALSSFQTSETGKLSVTAGDVLYVDLKEQKVPNWLWAYSQGMKKFGFIPESVVDQLKSSIV